MLNIKKNSMKMKCLLVAVMMLLCATTAFAMPGDYLEIEEFTSSATKVLTFTSVEEFERFIANEGWVRADDGASVADYSISPMIESSSACGRDTAIPYVRETHRNGGSPWWEQCVAEDAIMYRCHTGEIKFETMNQRGICSFNPTFGGKCLITGW